MIKPFIFLILFIISNKSVFKVTTFPIREIKQRKYGKDASCFGNLLTRYRSNKFSNDRINANKEYNKQISGINQKIDIVNQDLKSMEESYIKRNKALVYEANIKNRRTINISGQKIINELELTASYKNSSKYEQARRNALERLRQHELENENANEKCKCIIS